MDFQKYAFGASDTFAVSNQFPDMRDGDRIALHMSHPNEILWCHADYLGLISQNGTWNVNKNTEKPLADFLESSATTIVLWNQKSKQDMAFLHGLTFCDKVVVLEDRCRMRAGVWSSKVPVSSIEKIESLVCQITMTDNARRIMNIYSEGDFRGWW